MSFLVVLLILITFIELTRNIYIVEKYRYYKYKSVNDFNSLVENLTKLYHSEKRSLFKYDTLDYNFPNANIFMKRRNKPRQEILNDIYNLKDNPKLKDWNIDYTNSKTLTFSKNMFKIKLKF